MQLKQLEYFVKIVECGSISRAAKQLYISQPSITKAILGLEEEYGVQLLIRKARGIELTQDGKDFVFYAKNVLKAKARLDRVFSKKEIETLSRLSIAAQQTDFLYPMILNLYEKNKEWSIQYELTEMDRRMVVDSVIKGYNDIGILVHSSSDTRSFISSEEMQQLEVHVLDRAGVYIAVGPHSPLYNKKYVTYEESGNYTHILLDMEEEARETTYFKQIMGSVTSDKLLFFNTVSACEYFLKETDAVLFVAKWVMKRFQSDQIHFIPIYEEKAEQDHQFVDLLWIKRKIIPLNKTEQEFIQELENIFQMS